MPSDETSFTCSPTPNSRMTSPISMSAAIVLRSTATCSTNSVATSSSFSSEVASSRRRTSLLPGRFSRPRCTSKITLVSVDSASWLCCTAASRSAVGFGFVLLSQNASFFLKLVGCLQLFVLADHDTHHDRERHDGHEDRRGSGANYGLVCLHPAFRSDDQRIGVGGDRLIREPASDVGRQFLGGGITFVDRRRERLETDRFQRLRDVCLQYRGGCDLSRAGLSR